MKLISLQKLLFLVDYDHLCSVCAMLLTLESPMLQSVVIKTRGQSPPFDVPLALQAVPTIVSRSKCPRLKNMTVAMYNFGGCDSDSIAGLEFVTRMMAFFLSPLFFLPLRIHVQCSNNGKPVISINSPSDEIGTLHWREIRKVYRSIYDTDGRYTTVVRCAQRYVSITSLYIRLLFLILKFRNVQEEFSSKNVESVPEVFVLM